jgi:hypothetical protein
MGNEYVPANFFDLYTDLMNRTREKTGTSATYTLAKRYVNIALQDMHIGYAEKFPWAERSAILVTQPEYTTGTITVSKGSTSLFGAACDWTGNNDFGVANMRVGGKITINGGTDVYEIATVGSAVTATTTSAFVEDDVTTGTYKYFEDEYALASDFLRPVDYQQFSDGMEINLIGRTEFRRRYPRNYITGRPYVATIIDKAPTSGVTPNRKLRLHRPCDKAYSIPYTYITANLVLSGSAAGTITFTANPSGSDTLTLNGTTWTFVASGATGAQTNIGNTTVDTIDDLVSDLNESTDSNVRVATYLRDGNALRVEYDTPGAEGEGYTLAASTATVSASALALGTPKPQFTADEDEPLVPLRYRHAIVFHALYHYYRDRKDDVRSQEAKAEYTDLMLRIAGDTEIGQSRPQIRPRSAIYKRRAAAPWGGGRAKYDINNRFDRFEN